jgi:hypothetical protein
LDGDWIKGAKLKYFGASGFSMRSLTIHSARLLLKYRSTKERNSWSRFSRRLFSQIRILL